MYKNIDIYFIYWIPKLEHTQISSKLNIKVANTNKRKNYLKLYNGSQSSCKTNFLIKIKYNSKSVNDQNNFK